MNMINNIAFFFIYVIFLNEVWLPRCSEGFSCKMFVDESIWTIYIISKCSYIRCVNTFDPFVYLFEL